MVELFAATLAVAVGFCAVSFQRSSRKSFAFGIASAVLWTASIGLLWLNQTAFPNDETKREVGEILALAPLMLAIPFSAIAFVLLLAGWKTKKEA
ncbi:hypothetical protein VWX35_13635 [Phaeobacter sp. A36a-5a]|uniref:hypothetical protein n=1 Tax=Phaeobacter bryozoorum TaxID=1086632 RepID=UPI0030C9A872